MRSFETASVSGIYRTACCRSELTVRNGSRLPSCPQCRKGADWALVVRSELRPVETGRRNVSDPDPNPSV